MPEVVKGPPLEDRILHAEATAIQAARAGNGFTNPYEIGTPERRRWQEVYDSTPKGIPGMPETQHGVPGGQRVPGHIPHPTAPDLRADAPTVHNFHLDSPAVGGTVTVPGPFGPRTFPVPIRDTKEAAAFLAGEPTNLEQSTGYKDYEKLLKDAEQQGRADADHGKKGINENPYTQPPLNLAGPAAAWERGFKERSVDIAREKARAELDSRFPMIAQTGELVRTVGPSVRDLAAVAALPALIRWHCENGASASFGDNMAAAASDAVSVADWLVNEIQRRAPQ